MTRHIPSYDELERPDDSGLPLAWGVWGRDDQLGLLNHITPDKVRQATTLVQRGVRFNLDLPLHVPYGLCKPGAHRTRRAPIHEIHGRSLGNLMVRDDKLDEFYPQASSQWDGLTHMGDARHGFYNGVQSGQVTGEEGTRNGIEHLAAFGIVTRCVLADLPRHFARTGRQWAVDTQDVVTADELAACLEAQGVRTEPGDILLVRTGWVERFLGTEDLEQRDPLLSSWQFSGLSGGEDMWRFVWERRLAALAADNVAVEVWPPSADGPSLHLAIARLGLTLGEMFDMEAFAADCAVQGDYTALFTSSPLNLLGGVGSPPNAIAIR